MTTIGELNSLAVFEEMLDGPKSIDDLRRALLTGNRRRKSIPLLLPYSLEEFAEIHSRPGGTLREVSNGGVTKYEVRPEIMPAVRERIEQAFSNTPAQRHPDDGVDHRAVI